MREWRNRVVDSILGEQRWRSLGELPDTTGAIAYNIETGGNPVNWIAGSYLVEGSSNLMDLWGTVADRTELPNVAGATIQSNRLQVGDVVRIVAGPLFRCMVNTVGAATWYPVDESYLVGAGDKIVVFGNPAIELGEFSFNASLVEPIPTVFKAIFTVTAAGAVTALLKLYDIGPIGGPTGPPVLIATITFATPGGGGPMRDQSNALSWHDTTPSAGKLVRSERVYRVTAEVTAGGAGDQIHVGWAGIYVGS